MSQVIENFERRGIMYVMSSPSGAGKTTITRALLSRNDDVMLSVSATTRPRRSGEIHGQDYYFMSPEEFREMTENGNMLEHAKVFDHYYGTPREPVEQALSNGRDVLFDIDWQGTQQLREMAADDLVSIFILPPSRKALEKRLHTRSKDTLETREQIQSRMSKAASEMSHWSEYDYVIVNDDIERAVQNAQHILEGERLKRRRIIGLSDFVKGLIGGL